MSLRLRLLNFNCRSVIFNGSCDRSFPAQPISIRKAQSINKSPLAFAHLVYFYKINNNKYVCPGAHHPKRPSPILSLRDNLCPDWAIIRIVSREHLSLLRSAYGRNQRGKGQKWLRKTDEGCGTSLWSPFFSTLSSVIYEPQWRQKFAGNTCLKIAQSGLRLDHGYSVDGRSG